MISAEDLSILKDLPIPTWTDLLLKLFHPSLHPLDLMVLWMLMLLNSKPTWSLILVSISCCHHMPLSSQPKKLITNNSQLLKSPTLLSNQQTWWQNVTQDTENTWLAPWCTEEMSYQKMLMLLLLPSKLKEPFNSSIGPQLDSKSESTINLQLSYLVEI